MCRRRPRVYADSCGATARASGTRRIRRPRVNRRLAEQGSHPSLSSRAKQLQRFDPLWKVGHFVFESGDCSREINTLGSALPPPVRLCRGIVENAEALNDRLQILILLELDIGTRLERQDSILDVERRRRLPANFD